MPVGYSVHIGINQVDESLPNYKGWDSRLNACENDCDDMQRIAINNGFTHVTTLKTAEATINNVETAIRFCANNAVDGDIVLVTYSGHGGQAEDVSGDEVDDMLDELWYLYDGEFLDDRLYELIALFRKGVRFVLISDSCHSGTMWRDRDTPPPLPGEDKELGVPDAQVISISGCSDSRTSKDGRKNGLFTENLLKVYDDGKFTGSYMTLHRQILERVKKWQDPTFFSVGHVSKAFLKEKPFTV